MTDLTEKWKAGELPQWRFYYVLYSGGIEPILLNGENDFNNHCRIINSLIKEVLAPVPRYEELQDLKSECKSLSYGLDIAVKRNRYLLRLLKECKDRFVAVTTNIPINLEDCDLINRIHQEVYDLETEL